VTIYRHAGDIVEGIGLADLYGGFPVSFCGEARWRVPALALDVEQLVEEEESQWSTEVRHASLPQHVETHRNWLVLLRRRSVENAADLFRHRAELLPNIQFGPRIESDLRTLQPPAFFQVLEYLHRLNDAVEIWNPDISPRPDYPSKTTDESESRKPLCWFPSPVGGRELFSWHGRFTPGAGRIHFRLDRHAKRVVLGYIGRKLGT
jgi:hypothetical protein